MHKVSVPPERLSDVMRLRDGESVIIEEDGRAVVVHPSDEPRLMVERAPQCSIWGRAFDQDRCQLLKVPLDHARVEGDELHLDAYEGSFWWAARENAAMTLRAEDVHAITLQYTPPDRVRFGMGLVVLGPSRFAGYQFLLLPAPWLGLEAGLAGVPDAGAWVWSGLRVRPVEWGIARPFVGAFLNYGASGAGRDPALSDDVPGLFYRELAYGPRLGVDLALGRWIMLTLEADALRVEDAGGNARSELAGKWSATGGVAISAIY